MRVLVAPNAFAGTLTAHEAGTAIAAGWQRRRPDDKVTVVPVADGGQGTVTALSALGDVRRIAVENPFGLRVEAEWLRLGDVAIVESATACGRSFGTDPLNATTAGVGELICAALADGVRQIVVGVGGTATTDGGAGMAASLGAWLLDGSGHPVAPGGAALAALERIDLADVDPRLAGAEVVVAADVDNPLCGPEGAAVVYGPQKGATPAQAEELDTALSRYAAIVERDVPGASGIATRPHAGAGGGLGAGLMAFCGATARSGADVVLDMLSLSKRVALADLVVTGEGSFDWQSLRGKAPAAVARMARLEGVPCVVLAGQVAAGRREMGSHGIDAAYAVADLAGSVEESIDAPSEWLEELAARVAGEWSR